jgi:hypothetical protein
MGRLAVEFHADPELVVEQIEISAAAAMDDLCLPSATGQPVRPLNVAQIPVFQRGMHTVFHVT